MNQVVYELQGHCNFLAQCALVASQDDMKDIIGQYELSSVCLSFMDNEGELNHDDEAKSKIVDILIKHVNQSKIPASECPGADIVAIGTMQIVQKMLNPASVKTFENSTDYSGRGRAHRIMSRGRHCV